MVDSDAALPSAGVIASAPAKIVLFGEYASIYGQPSIGVALEHLTICKAAPGRKRFHTVNHHKINQYRDTYIKKAVEKYWKGGSLDFSTDSNLPSASGVGSSASITAATMGALLGLENGFSEEECGIRSHTIECLVEKRVASPIDTATVTHGSGVLVSGTEGDGLLWKTEFKGRTWYVHGLDIPEITFVLGWSGSKAKTPLQVKKVMNFKKRQKDFYMDIMKDMGKLALEGMAALKDQDMAAMGKLMDRNHRLMAILGINTPALQAMVDAVKPHAYGAKVTGAGGGGCMVAMTKEPEEASMAIKRIGGTPIIARSIKQGVKVERLPGK